MLIIGAAGVGKSTLATQYAVAGARRGDKAVVFIFDETVWTYRARGEKLGFPIAALLADGILTLRQIDTAEVSAGQFANMVSARRASLDRALRRRRRSSRDIDQTGARDR